jgi:hypothetical protein
MQDRVHAFDQLVHGLFVGQVAGTISSRSSVAGAMAAMSDRRSTLA